MDLTVVRRLAGFGGSHFGRTLTWVAADLYALYALTQVAHLQPALAGLVFLVTMSLSAVCDFAIGWALDRRGIPSTPWLVAAALASSAALVVSLTARSPIIAVSAAIGFRLTYALYDVPHNAMLQRLRDDATPVVTLSAVRFLTGAAASFAVAGLAAGLMGDHGRGLSSLAWIAGVVAGVSMALYAPAMARDPYGQGEGGDLSDGAALAPILALVAVALLGAVMGGLLTKALAFIADLQIGRGDWSGRALAILTIGRVASAPVWTFAARRRPLLQLTALAFGVVALGGLAMALSPRTGLLILDLSIAVLGFGFGGVTVYSWALLPDLGAALRRGSSHETIHRAVAAYTALNKLALGLSGGVMAGLLTVTTAQALSPSLGLVLMLGGSVCAVLIVGRLSSRKA